MITVIDECRICGNATDNAHFRAREMMFGTRDEFEYVACAECGCLQIASPPRDLDRYYPPGYYSLAPTRENGNGLRGRLAAIRAAHLLGERSILGTLIVHIRGPSPEIAALGRLAIPRHARILDVGCGRGDLLRKLAEVGFTHLRGADAYVSGDLHYPDGVHVTKAPLETLTGSYDVVMMHHSLEHMADQRAAMEGARRLVAPSGVVIVRTPLADSTASRLYRSDWVQLDAPRHLFVHTRQSLTRLAEQAGFDVTDVIYDSTAFQFWASELYRKDVPLYCDSSGTQVSDPQLSRGEMRRYEQQARELNAQQLGDQACFYLRPRGTA